MNTPNNKPGRDMERDIWHILTTGELPSSAVKSFSTSIEDAERVKVLMQYFTSKLHQATEEARQDMAITILRNDLIAMTDHDIPIINLIKKRINGRFEAQLTAGQNNKDES